MELIAVGVVVGLLVLVAGYVRSTGELGSGRVPVLIYHRVVRRGIPLRPEDEGERGCIVFDDEFRDHLLALRQAGYTSISPEDFLAHHAGRAPLPERPVLITFDDGWQSVHDLAYPALRDARMTATVFVNTVPDNPNFVAGEPVDRSMTPEMVRTLHEGGITIGSHGATHRFLTTCDPDELREELGSSKAALEEWTGAEVDTLAAPGGQSDRAVAHAAREAGYVMFFGGGSGTIGRQSDLMALPRLGVERDTPGARLVANLRPMAIIQHRLVRELKLLPTRALGPVVSNRIRKAIVGSGLGWILRVAILKRIVLGGAILVVVGALWLIVR